MNRGTIEAGQTPFLAMKTVGEKTTNKGDDLAAAERRLKVLDLRKSGASYRSIVTLLESQGITASRSQVHRDVQAALKQLRKKERLEVEELREMELERLDAMQLGIWQLVISGRVSAVFAALAISKRRAELCGLDAPEKHELTGKNGAPIATVQMTVQEWREQARARREQAGATLKNFEGEEN